ncbi:unnamed protein product, partial [Adineta steineri]
IFIYYEDPRGSIPKALWTWAAKFGVPIYAKLTHNACLSYPNWIKDKQTKLPDVTENDIDSAAESGAAILTTNDNDNTQEK